MALPLSLGIAIASDAPVLAGLIAAIVGGIVVGAIGGSPLQVNIRHKDHISTVG